MSAKVPTMVDFIYDADPAALARIFEAAFARLGELGRDASPAHAAVLEDLARRIDDE